jgi:transcriptional regulator with XRE-family HTH domain
MDLKEVVARNLWRLRQEARLTQEELADRAGISSRYVGAIERSKVSISVTVLGQIAEALAIDPCDLLRPGQEGASPGPASPDLAS